MEIFIMNINIQLTVIQKNFSIYKFFMWDVLVKIILKIE